MRRRFPQPVRVGDLIGLPLLDWDDSTIGYVRHVVRTPEGKIQLIVNQGRLFGWGGRLVQVPIEAVAILARQLDLLDISVEEFRAAPAWSAATTQPIPSDDMIKIALSRESAAPMAPIEHGAVAGDVNQAAALLPLVGQGGRGVVVAARDASANSCPHPQPLPSRLRACPLPAK